MCDMKLISCHQRKRTTTCNFICSQWSDSDDNDNPPHFRIFRMGAWQSMWLNRDTHPDIFNTRSHCPQSQTICHWTSLADAVIIFWTCHLNLRKCLLWLLVFLKMQEGHQHESQSESHSNFHWRTLQKPIVAGQSGMEWGSQRKLSRRRFHVPWYSWVCMGGFCKHMQTYVCGKLKHVQLRNLLAVSQFRKSSTYSSSIVVACCYVEPSPFNILRLYSKRGITHTFA